MNDVAKAIAGVVEMLVGGVLALAAIIVLTPFGWIAMILAYFLLIRHG